MRRNTNPDHGLCVRLKWIKQGSGGETNVKSRQFYARSQGITKPNGPEGFAICTLHRDEENKLGQERNVEMKAVNNIKMLGRGQRCNAMGGVERQEG